MPQSVFDVGDPITSRLKLGVTPDGSTVVGVDVYRPDGTAIADPPISGWGSGAAADEKTAQFYATDTGIVSAATTAAAGDWLVVWTVTGTGAGVQAKVYNVRALPSASDDRPLWAPFLSDVADHISAFTVDVTTPGSATHLGTFVGGLTNPSDEQAHRLMDAHLATVTGQVGTVPAVYEALARLVVSLRTAASICRSFWRTETDLRTADALDRRADAEMKRLTDASGDAADPDAEVSPAFVFFAAAADTTGKEYT